MPHGQGSIYKVGTGNLNFFVFLEPGLPSLFLLISWKNKDIDIFLILQDKTGDDEGDYPDYIFMYHTMKRTSINLSISVQNIDQKVWFKSGWVIN